MRVSTPLLSGQERRLYTVYFVCAYEFITVLGSKSTAGRDRGLAQGRASTRPMRCAWLTGR